MAEMSEKKRQQLAMYKAEVNAAKRQLQRDQRHETWRRLKKTLLKTLLRMLKAVRV